MPHEFSGGQRQRIGLARALMLKPDVLIADEPVSALDVTVQAQVLNLLDDVRRQMNLAMLFITHDMRVAAQVCHRVMVMRHGKVVETGPTRDIFARPSSDYTKALLAAIPGRQAHDIGERHAHRHRRVQAGNQQFRALHHHGEDLRGTVSASRRRHARPPSAMARLEIPGALDAIKEAGATPVPLLATMAMASGTVERKASTFHDRDRGAAEGGQVPVDGVFLALHGAMIVEDEPDAESEIVRRVRAVVPGTPITVSLDLHGHITAAMIQPDVAYIGYREFPHIDMYETGYRAAKLLVDWINGKVKPVMALSKRHMVFSPDTARTGVAPMSDIVAEGRAMEARGEVLHVSLFPVQPWIDTPDLGFAALVCAQSKEAAQAAADKLAKMAWDRRTEFEPDVTALEETIRIGLSSPGLTVASDAGDAPSGGGAGDSTAVLAALLHAGADRADRISICTICRCRSGGRSRQGRRGQDRDA